MSDKGAKLRAMRPPPPPRLVEHGDDDPREKPPLEVTDSALARPLTLMRLGGADLEAGLRAAAAGPGPSAVVLSIAEGRETAVRARRSTSEFGIPRLSDPLLFRTGLAGYRTSPNLQSLDYTPRRDADPFGHDEFDDDDLVRRVGRSVVGAQVDLGASAAFSGAFVMNSLSDPWIQVNQRLLQIGLDAAAAWNIPLFGVLPFRLQSFEGGEAQQWLLRALSAHQPAAWTLLADGLAESSPPDRIVAALKLAAELRAGGSQVLLGRSGDLRELFWAFGFGTEFGLGRMLRFSIPDFTSARRGPGPASGPRVESPSLASSLPNARALDLLDKELIAEIDCDCPVCKQGSLAKQPNSIPEHDAYVVLRQSMQFDGVDLSTRVSALDQKLEAALKEWRRVELEGGDIGRPLNLERRRRALHLAVESGLLQPERFGAALRLVE